MKKKLFGALLLSVLMLLSLFAMTSCNSDEEEEEHNRSYVTLTMWVIWEGHDPQNNTAMKLENDVQTAFNEVCMETYSSKVVFNWCKDEAEYRTKIAAANADPADINKAPTYGADGYPVAEENQLDLVLILDKDMYLSFAENGDLTNLNSMLSTTYKDVRNELGQYLEYTTVNGASGNGNYAILNPNGLGEYTYLLVHKEAARTFQFAESDFTNIASCMRLIDEVQNAKGSSDPAIPTSVKSLYPLLSAFDYYNAYFYTPYSDSSNADRDVFDFLADGKNGLVATFWNAKTMYGTIGDKSIVNALQSDDYLSYLALMNWAEKNAVYPTDTAAADEGRQFAVAVMTGDYGLRNIYTDYYCVVLDTPRLSGDNFYNGMWGVSAHSRNPERAMEIISALETDEKLLNILVYGVKGEQYSYNTATDTITSFGTYYVNPRYCGSIFHVYADESRGQDEGWYEEMKTQRIEWQSDLWIGFDYVVGTYHKEVLKHLASCTQLGVSIYNCPECGLGASYHFNEMKEHIDSNTDGACDDCGFCIEHKDQKNNTTGSNTPDTFCDRCDACAGNHVDDDKDGVCDSCSKLADHTSHTYSERSAQPVYPATCTLPALYAYTCECEEGGTRYRASGVALGHKDDNGDDLCDGCGQTYPVANHTHQDYYNEYALKNDAAAYEAMCKIQEASNDIFDILLSYSLGNAEGSAEANALEGLGVLEYATAFKAKAAELNTLYFDQATGIIRNQWILHNNSQDLNTNETLDYTLAGNLRRWYLSLQGK